MAKRMVDWTKTADIPFVGVLECWGKRNKSNIYSKKLVRLVSERTKQISKTPFICKPTDFKDIRVASRRNFSIFYKVTDDQLIITAFWGNRQDRSTNKHSCPENKYLLKDLFKENYGTHFPSSTD